MEYMIGTIDQFVDDPRRQRSNRNMNFIRRNIALMCFMFGKFLGNYLVVLYLFVKMLYIMNCVGQLFLISILLGRNYYIYGASIFRDMLQGKGYADSEYFPRVTQCKFQVRELGLKNFSHEYNVQCVLPINLFNQQIFTFLWFWYLILLVINTSALLIWVYRFIPKNQYNYAIRRIKLLRIRLIENSKLPKDGKKVNKNQRAQTIITNEFDSQARNYSMHRILNDKDNQYLFDDFKEDPNADFYRYRDPYSRSNLTNESRMFPNLPNDFNYQSSFHETSLKYQSFNYRSRSPVNDASFYMPFANDYESYIPAASFSVKNYKEFVYEYLESDGKSNLSRIILNNLPKFNFFFQSERHVYA